MAPSSEGVNRPRSSNEPLRCRAPAIPTVQADDAKVRVTRWDFDPGAETGWHRHGYGYVVVPITDGTMLIELPGGATMDVQLKAGLAYARDAGMEHNVVNGGTAPLSFVEVEIKGLPG